MIRLLTELDVNAALKLSQEAGWNQTEADWRRVLALAPDGCFAIDREGSLAATATVVCYGRALAWIGMVLTRDRFRRLGLARLLVEYALEFSRQRRIPVIGLDASEMGWPLYTSLGFREECAIERWGAGAANSRAV
ncbi:MAG: GNAT family N-acetyltransferase, partial [Bryobacteraceae bacterium]